MKLMFMGSANAGRTTLLLQLTKKKGKLVRQRPVQMGINGIPLSTVGVELGQWEYSPKLSSPPITFMTWDFGGQVFFRDFGGQVYLGILEGNRCILKFLRQCVH